jgi:hypothetical protein
MSKKSGRWNGVRSAGGISYEKMLIFDRRWALDNNKKIDFKISTEKNRWKTQKRATSK